MQRCRDHLARLTMTDDSASSTAGPLSGCRVLVTRERPGELGRLLADRGADVIHVPLIGTTDPPDDGVELAHHLDCLEAFDWVMVTSPAGAERVGTAVRACVDVSLAAVGTATAQRLAELAGRPVDLVPATQTAAALASDFNHRATAPQRVLLAQADRAADTLSDAVRAGGHTVTVVTAYSTVLVEPDIVSVAGADVLVLASGSAAASWVEALGVARPPIVAAIGPSTAAKAHELGLVVDGVAGDHSLVGLVDEVVRLVTQSGLPDHR